MDSTHLKRLRLKQFASINIAVVAAICLFLLWGDYVSYSVLWIGLGVLFLIQGLFSLFGNMTPLALVLPFLRELKAYENEKLGKEAEKLYKSEGSLSLGVALLCLFNGWMNWGQQTMMSVEEIWPFVIVFTIVMLIVLNIFLMVHNRKIDHAEKGELLGFASRSFARSLVTGTVLAFIFIVGVVVYMIVSRS